MIKIALLQMASNEADPLMNLQKGITFCRQAKRLECDIALFPEMWNVGYYAVHPDEVISHVKEFRSKAVSPDSTFVREHIALAKDLKMVIASTYLEAPTPKDSPKGVMVVINSDGKVALKYEKVHTCDFDMGAIYEPGKDFPVASVDTSAGPIIIGAMLCYDREFPETARILMLRGAEIILTANCCTLDDKRINQFQTRAFENAVAVAMTNYPAPQTNGRSVAFDARGDKVVLAGPDEGIFLASFDVDALRDYRRTCGWGNAYRRPGKYSMLTSNEVKEPFLRTDALGRPFDRNAR
jgi:predicted amidohydrolase